MERKVLGVSLVLAFGVLAVSGVVSASGYDCPVVMPRSGSVFCLKVSSSGWLDVCETNGKTGDRDCVGGGDGGGKAVLGYWHTEPDGERSSRLFWL